RFGQRGIPGLTFYCLPDSRPGWRKKDDGPNRSRQSLTEFSEVEIALMPAQDEGLNVRTERINSRQGSVGYRRNRVVVKGNTAISADRFKAMWQRLECPDCF